MKIIINEASFNRFIGSNNKEDIEAIMDFLANKVSFEKPFILKEEKSLYGQKTKEYNIPLIPDNGSLTVYDNKHQIKNSFFMAWILGYINSTWKTKKT